MCYHLQSPTIDQIIAQFPEANYEDIDFLSGDLNGFDLPLIPAFIWDEETNNLSFQPMQWGLIPHWAKEDSIAHKTLNARIETVTERPSFKDYIEHRMSLLVKVFMSGNG